MAASDRIGTLRFELPTEESGLRNYERAQVSKSGSMSVFGITIDSLQIPNRVSLAKIDAEGHETEILNGMRQTIVRDLPIVIVEDNGGPIPPFLNKLGYESKKIQSNSPNIVLMATRMPSC